MEDSDGINRIILFSEQKQLVYRKHSLLTERASPNTGFYDILQLNIWVDILKTKMIKTVFEKATNQPFPRFGQAFLAQSLL